MEKSELEAQLFTLMTPFDHPHNLPGSEENNSPSSHQLPKVFFDDSESAFNENQIYKSMKSFSLYFSLCAGLLQFAL